MKNMDKVLEMVGDYIQKGIFPGANFAILEGEIGEMQTEFVRGNRQILPEKKPLESGLLWDLASVTKVVGTGTAVINLLADQRLELDETLQQYLPEFANGDVTLRQLLTHTSGINPYIPGRDGLSKAELKTAILQIEVTADKTFRYTDLNFILLGFLLEKVYDKPLDQIFQAEIFEPWQMRRTQFGPVAAADAVATSLDVPVGAVHDPKARVLGVDCGSAGLFSDLTDLSNFVRGYFADGKYEILMKNFILDGQVKKRSLAWDLPVAENPDWLLHTGYTGTFILMNLRLKKAVIFLSNRVHLKDERAQWIKDRDKLIGLFIENLTRQ